MILRSILAGPALACALAGAMPVLVQAADKPKAAARAAGVPLLTREELRACLAQQSRIRSERDEVTRLRERLEADQAEIRRSGAVLKAQLESLDRSSQQAVDDYNTQAGARDRAIDEFEARAAAFSPRAQALAGDQAAYAKACEDRRFDEKDEIAIKNGK